VAKPRIEIAPVQTEDRQLNTFNKDARLATTDIFKRLEVLEAPQALVVPKDDHTLFWWPCNELGPRWNNSIGNAPSHALVPRVVGGALPAPAGLVTPYAARCVELATVADRGVEGASGAFATMPPRGITLSAWVRAGGDLSTAQYFGIGVLNAANLAVFNLALISSGRLDTTARLVSAGAVGVTTTLDAALTPHEWNHVALCLDTSGNLYSVVNGIMTSTFVGGDQVDWGTSPPLRFAVGFPGSATYCGGLIQDIRLETTARSETYLANAWRRGKQLTVI
jgi:hypothetical protein